MFGLCAAIQQFVFGLPSFVHGAVVDCLGERIILQESGGDVVGLAGVG